MATEKSDMGLELIKTSLYKGNSNALAFVTRRLIG